MGIAIRKCASTINSPIKFEEWNDIILGEWAAKQAADPNWKCLKTFVRKWKSREILKIESNDRPAELLTGIVFDFFRSHCNKSGRKIQQAISLENWNEPRRMFVHSQYKFTVLSISSCTSCIFMCALMPFHSLHEIYFCFILFPFKCSTTINRSALSLSKKFIFATLVCSCSNGCQFLMAHDKMHVAHSRWANLCAMSL